MQMFWIVQHCAAKKLHVYALACCWLPHIDAYRQFTNPYLEHWPSHFETYPQSPPSWRATCAPLRTLSYQTARGGCALIDAMM